MRFFWMVAIGVSLLSLSWGATYKTVPRVQWKSAKAAKHLRKEEPVILQETTFAQPAHKWDLAYLTEHWVGKKKLVTHTTTDTSVAGRWLFPYEEDRVANSRRDAMTMARFLDGKSQRVEDGRGQYVQQTLIDTLGGKAKRLGKAIEQDINEEFNWKLVDWLSDEFGWFRIKDRSEKSKHSFMLKVWVGDKQTVTPLHYDQGAALLFQARGQKTVHLFDPSAYDLVCPRPYIDDRGILGTSTVTDLANASAVCGKFANAKGHMAVINPGEMLHIPNGWWHHVEQTDDEALPISFSVFWKSEWKSEVGSETGPDIHDLTRKRLSGDHHITSHLVGLFGRIKTFRFYLSFGRGEFDLDEDGVPAAEPADDMLEMYYQIWPDVMEQIEMFLVLKPGETAAGYMKWLALTRFNVPVPEATVKWKGQKPKKKDKKKKKKKKKKSKDRGMDGVRSDL